MNDANNAGTLLPCPFCNGHAEYGAVDCLGSQDHGGHFIQCSDAGCGASVGLIFTCGGDPKPLLAERWNTRAHSGMNLTEAMTPFIGTPECRLKRFTKSSARAAYFCEQCKHFSKTNECPFRHPKKESRDGKTN